MPYKELLYESERRRLYLEANKRNNPQLGDLEKQINGLNKKK